MTDVYLKQKNPQSGLNLLQGCMFVHGSTLIFNSILLKKLKLKLYSHVKAKERFSPGFAFGVLSLPPLSVPQK